MTASGIDFAEHVGSVDGGIRLLLLAVADCAQRDAAWGESAAVRDEAKAWLETDEAAMFCEYVGLLFGRELAPGMLKGNIERMRSGPRPMQRGNRPRLTDEQRAANAERMKVYQREYHANYKRGSRAKEVAA